jgi:alkanesulfonate monooxygenase SsuD/methylene tetrahydromethanopterin reductase-like flavin-dependent oxidoreductase (luciferase family)
MQFGIYIRPAATYEAMLELARFAEEEGFFGVFLNDHVEGLSGDREEPYLEAWTAMAGIGVETRRIRVGHITLFNSLRNPAYLAKSISTLDVMTGGRYETIIGCGWNEPEYDGYDLMEGGRGMPTAGERVTRLKEAVQILHGMFHNPVFSFEGRYWRLREAVNVPQPAQRPMRISVGARQPRMIRIAAKYADGINASGGMGNIIRTMEVLRPTLEATGKTLDDYMVSGFAPVTIAQNEGEYETIVRGIAERTSRSVHDVRADVFSGTPEILVGRYREAQDLGVDLMILIPRANDLEGMKEGLARFRDEVALRI